MSGGASDTGGVPPGIAAIMAAIRQEVIAPPAGPAPSEPAATVDEPPGPAAPPSAPPAPRAGAAVALPTLDDEARALLAPMLRDWLDAHLPEIVEAAVDAELRRLTGQVGVPSD